MRPAARYTLIGAAVLAVVLVLAVLFFTRTRTGVERAGQFAVEQVRASVNGELTVDRITSGGLLRGVTLHGVAIDGPEGRPFLRADSARLAYRFRSILGRAMAFDRLVLHGPEVFVERLPGDDEWNYERIFPGDTTAPDTTVQRDLVLIEDAVIHGGRAFIRTPWEPNGGGIAEDTARMLLERVPGGIVRTLRFDDVEARLPRIVWESPEEEARLIQISQLSTRAYLWESPLEVQALEGAVTLRDSLISFDVPRVRLPASGLSAIGQVVAGEDENRYDIRLDGADVAFADFQWLHPSLPADGGGDLRLRIQSREPGSILWLAQDAHLRTGGTEVAGSFGVVTGDTLYFTNVDLNASPLDLDLLQRLVPADLSLEGLLIGTIEVEGPISALHTRGDVRIRTFQNGDGAESTVRWAGVVGAEPPYAVRDLEADIRDLDLEQVAQFAPRLRLRGTATGRVRANGSFERGLELTGDVAIVRDGRRSAVHGSGRFTAGARGPQFDLRFDAAPLALELVTEQFPELGAITGDAQGPVILAGTLDDLRLDADIQTPAGGILIQGTLALDGGTPRYQAEGVVTDFELHKVAAELPTTVVSGQFSLRGEGGRPGTLAGTGAVDLFSAHVAGVEVRRSGARFSIADGLLHVDSLVLNADVGTVRADGSFGIVAGRHGELAVTGDARGLALLEPLLFPAPELDPFEDLGEQPLPAQPERRLDGHVQADIVFSGSLQQWAVAGHVGAQGLVYDRVQLGEATADIAWRPDSLAIDAAIDSLKVEQRRLPHARASLEWTPSGGRLVARARGIGSHRLDVEGGFERTGDIVELRLRQLDLSVGDARWSVVDTVRARLGLDGVQVDSLVLLRMPDEARIRVAGTLPWRRPEMTEPQQVDLAVDLDRVRIGELLRITQTDTTVDGVVSGRFRVAGTALAPEWSGRIMAQPFRYHGAVLDSVGGEISYASHRLRTRFSGWRGGEPIVSGVGAVPLDLALTDREDRLLDESMDIRIQLDSVPASLVSFAAPGVRDLGGALDGSLAVAGPPREPSLEGVVRLIDGTAFFEPLNVRYRGIQAVVHMGTGRILEVDARFATERGTGHVLGTLDVTRPRDPGFDLAVTARELDATRRRDVSAVATGRARVTGRYTRPIISGELRILRGEMNLDEMWRQYQVVQLDPSLFRMFDSTDVSFRPPPEVPFLNNLVLTNTTIQADRNFWLRSRELNVEVSGSLDVEVDRQADDLRLTGTLQAVGGNYALQLAQGVPGRTFEIRGGSIDFVGTPGIDPDLEIEAGYRVRRVQGDPIDVLAQVSGTLRDPRVRLTSDSDLLLSESDLASYILFGRSRAELTQAETDVLSSGISLVRPVATSMLSSGLQQLLTGTGLPVNYVAFSTAEWGLNELGDNWQNRGLMGVMQHTQLEVGLDAGRDVSLVLSGRLPNVDGSPDGSLAWPQFGARVEWRFRPTWTTELYVEDRFARTPSFGLSEIDDRKVWGLSLLREWGY